MVAVIGNGRYASFGLAVCNFGEEISQCVS
jgi:hypothetical protein